MVLRIQTEMGYFDYFPLNMHIKGEVHSISSYNQNEGLYNTTAHGLRKEV